MDDVVHDDDGGGGGGREEKVGVGLVMVLYNDNMQVYAIYQERFHAERLGPQDGLK